MRFAAALTTIALAVARANDAQCAATPAAGVWGGSWTSIADSPTESTACLWPLSVVDYAVCVRWPFWETAECVECTLQFWGVHFLCDVKTGWFVFVAKVLSKYDLVVETVKDPVTRADDTLVLSLTFEAESAEKLCTDGFEAAMVKAVQEIFPELDFSTKKVEIVCASAKGRLRRLAEGVKVDVEISDDDEETSEEETKEEEETSGGVS